VQSLDCFRLTWHDNEWFCLVPYSFFFFFICPFRVPLPTFWGNRKGGSWRHWNMQFEAKCWLLLAGGSLKLLVHLFMVGHNDRWSGRSAGYGPTFALKLTRIAIKILTIFPNQHETPDPPNSWLLIRISITILRNATTYSQYNYSQSRKYSTVWLVVYVYANMLTPFKGWIVSLTGSKETTERSKFKYLSNKEVCL